MQCDLSITTFYHLAPKHVWKVAAAHLRIFSVLEQFKMTTSLAQQLQKLAAPQTSGVLADARSRASILFDHKEAATKDRRAIYEIAVSGLQELTAFNPTFKEFQLTLFDEATLTLERAVENAEVNKLLDASITKFLRLLSPYFMLRPAHMCFSGCCAVSRCMSIIEIR